MRQIFFAQIRETILSAFIKCFSQKIATRNCPALDKYMLSPKLRCSTGIFGLRKAVTTHVKKDRFFSTCVDIANQLLTRHSPLAPLGQVDG